MMQGKIARLGFAPPSLAVSRLRAAATILIVETPDALRLLETRRDGQGVVLTQKRMLGAAMIRTIAPEAIVGPLIHADWDIVDLALTLDDCGFRGDLYAVSRPLPRAELVVREVAAVCPGLKVHLIEIG